MSMTFLNQISLIPALLIVMPGLLLLRGQDKERSARRLLLYMLGMGVVLLLALFLTLRFPSGPYSRSFFQLATLLTPSILGITSLILLNVRAAAKMDGKIRIMVITAGLIMLILFGLLWNSQLSVGYLILPGVLLLGIGWGLGKRFGRLVIVLSLLSLFAFYWFNQLLNHPPDYDTSPSRIFGLLAFPILYVVPALSVVMSALLITSSLQLVSNDNPPQSLHRRRWFQIALAILLPLCLAYTIFWGSVWDQTSDGLTGLFLTTPSAALAVGAGIVMFLTLQGRNRLAGLLFTIIVPILLYQSFEAGWRISYHEMTERRATRISQALDRYQKREGYFPKSLEDLTPRDLLFVQQPVLLAGETWCYEGGTNYYQLSAFYREFFSAPVSLHVYASAGQVPTGPSACDERLPEMKQKYYSPMEHPNAMQPPVPTPQPENNDVEIPKVEIQPVFNGVPTIPGSWSPDSSYFVFATQENGLVLHFIKRKTGEVCTSDAQFSAGDSIRDHHAWLPDGRLLYVDGSGNIMALTPCQSGGEQLSNRFPESVNRIASVAPLADRSLLQSENAYWILDERTITTMPIPDVTPVPYEFHWDNYAWLPTGERLVVARLDGRKGSNAGSTLYLIDSNTAAVLKDTSLEGEFGQSAPWIEILSDHELLVNGIGEWLIVDFSTDPPATTNVLADIFGVDVRFPDEISASGSFVNPDGSGYYLAVRLNHSRNQATYLYDSKTKQVLVYNHESHTLLIFPNGYLMEMPQLEVAPTYKDEYDVVLVDQPEVVQPKLKIEGHTPREYPHLSLAYLGKRSQLAIASEQGLSIVSLPDGGMVSYWELIGNGYSPWVVAAPNDSALIASKDFGGLYFIPLPPE